MTIEAGEVGKDIDACFGKGVASELAGGVALARVDLEGDGSAGRNDAGGVAQQEANEVEAVGAAVEGEARLGGESRVRGDLGGAEVGEVGEDEIDRIADRGEERSLDEGHAVVQPEASAVLRGDRQGGGGEIDGGDAPLRIGRQQGGQAQRDCS